MSERNKQIDWEEMSESLKKLEPEIWSDIDESCKILDGVRYLSGYKIDSLGKINNSAFANFPPRLCYCAMTVPSTDNPIPEDIAKLFAGIAEKHGLKVTGGQMDDDNYSFLVYTLKRKYEDYLKKS